MPSITNKEYFIIKSYTKLACLLFAINGVWDEKSNLVKERTKFKFLGKFLQVVPLSFSFPWVIISIIRIKVTVFAFSSQKAETNNNLMIHIFYILMLVDSLSVFMLHLGFIISSNDLVCLLNQLLTFSRQLKQDFKSLKNREKYFVTIQLLFVSSICPASLCVGLFEAHNMWTLTRNWIPSLFAGISICFAIWPPLTLFGFCQSHVYLYFSILKATLSNEFSKKNASEQVFITSGLRVTKMIKNYRSLQIMCNCFNNSYCLTIVPTIKYIGSFVGMTCVMIAIYMKNIDGIIPAIIRYGHFVFAFYSFVMSTVAINLMSSVWQTSCQFNWDFKHNLILKCRNPKMLKKYVLCTVTSFRPLRFQIGGTYYLDKEAKLTYADFLISGTASALILVS